MSDFRKDIFMGKCRKGCPYYGRNACGLLADHDLFDDEYIKGCPLDTEGLISKQLISGGQLEILAMLNPVDYLKSISYLRRNNPPKVGDICITLQGGFSTSSPGKLVEVDHIDDIGQIYLVNPIRKEVREQGTWIVTIASTTYYDRGWWDYLYVYIESSSLSEDSFCEVDNHEVEFDEEDYFDED